MSFKLSENFLNKYKERKPDWGFNGLGELVYFRCVDENTPVLCGDLTWKPAGKLKVGDKLIAFDEHTSGAKYSVRHLKHAVVTHNKIEEAECMGIELEDGTVLYATPDHPWLVKPQGYGQIKWVQTKDLEFGPRNTPIFMLKFSKVWEPDISYEAGYLAAAFDGEGSLDGISGLVCVQAKNELYNCVIKYLEEKNFKFTVRKKKNYNSDTSFSSNKDCYAISLWGRDQILRFMGEIRPKRLMNLYLSRLERISLKTKDKDEHHIKVKRVFPAGKRRIAVLSTSASTHFTGGFPSHNTYSRIKSDGDNEQWWETCQRVVEGTYNIQKDHIDRYGLGWNAHKAQYSAQEMYDRMFTMKFLPGGRGLWAMGSPIIKEKRLAMALFNCSGISTEDIKEDPAFPFIFAFDVLMCGCGLGFDTKGAGKIIIQEQNKRTFDYIIPDTREGWVESLKYLIESFFGKSFTPVFDYSGIRPAGLPLKNFGGKSSGFQPLKDLHDQVTKLLNEHAGMPISVRNIVDIFNLIAKAVVSGNVRRSALLAGGEATEEFLDLKDYEKNPERVGWGWSSNNSVLAEVGMDYTDIAKRIKLNGEPGLLWLENTHNFKRMGEKQNGDVKDNRTKIFNPCFTGDNKLLTDKGYKTFDELSDIDYDDTDILFINKNNIAVKGKVWSSGVRETIKLKLSDKTTIKCTPDHVLMDIKSNEILAKDSKKVQLMPYYSFNQTINDFVKYGFIQGDGCTGRLDSKKHLGLEIHIGRKDIDIAKIFNIHVEENKRAYYVTGYNDILRQLGFSSKQLPDRELPSTIDSWTNEKKLSFLKGLYSANGSVITKHRISFKSTCKKLIEHLQTILKSYAIESYITTNKPTKVKFNNGEYLCKESYDLNISMYQSVLNFAKYINFVHNYKQQSLKELIMYKAPQVMTIENNGTENVFDFSLQDNTHWGVVNGYVVHNCAEIALESAELCNLIEVFPNKHEDKEDFLRSMKFAYLYAKTVTLLETHWSETNRIILRNRRIGTSVSGIAQFLAKYNLTTLKDWLNDGYKALKDYDKIYSDWLAIPRSIRLSTQKPSGSISLLGGTTPGLHFPESRFYIRRVRLAKNSELIKPLKKAGYLMEDAFGQEDSTVVVEFPVDVGEGVKTLKDVSMWEQLSLTAFIQKEWADNAVSSTITFNPEKEGDQIASALDYFQYQLKGISFLPKHEGGAYKQMPYEEITEKQYKEMTKKLKPLNFSNISGEEVEVEKYCNNDTCTLDLGELNNANVVEETEEE